MVNTTFKKAEEIPCGCEACDNGVSQGHFACEQSPAWALRAEREKLLVRDCQQGRWAWIALPAGDGGNGHVRIPSNWF